MVEVYAGGVRCVGGIEEVEDVHGRQRSLLLVAQRVGGGRRTRGAGRGIDDGDSARVCVGGVFDVGIAGDEGLGVVLLDAVLLLVLGLGLLLLVELALVLLVLGDA